MNVSIDRMNIATPSTGPSMSPNTVPSQDFDASIISREGWEDEDRQDDSVVNDLLMAIQGDMMSRVVLSASCGVSTEYCRAVVLPMLCHTKNARELVLVDFLTDEMVTDACAVMMNTPTITSLVLVNSTTVDGLSHAGLSSICSLVYSSHTLSSLSLVNCLHSIVGDAMKMLGEAITFTRALRRLSLESNNIQDTDFLPFAQGLASQRTLVQVCLDNNSLYYHGYGMMSEVMGYNEVLQVVSMNGNLIKVPTDVFEGYYIQEQCEVNRELARLGPYSIQMHGEWPTLWRRKMRRLWRVQAKSKVATPEEWEQVLQWLDPRGYVEQKVKLWMKMEPPQPQQVAPQIWRHT
eukprot:TRINITY_DN34802_c0_g1_i1.p1 TRINITY_DN34802_c0_g1~~TRINITY_DN34802_c0_g1_i1.p1  ORF type:complete len:349 (+),score=112.58 TRINITY_DN34802_c0_g1_i1:36-1082(+)